MKRRFITISEIAGVTGECADTITKRARLGFYKGATGGGKGSPWRVPVRTISKLTGIAEDELLEEIASEGAKPNHQGIFTP